MSDALSICGIHVTTFYWLGYNATILIYILNISRRAWFAVNMSLFKWTTPERRRVDRILPIIPNEIYFNIFEYIAPPNGRLMPEELRIFTNLSCVCRFFANVCLPRIFEFVEFSGSIFRDDTPTGLRNDAVYKTSRDTTLCTQIAAKQPLALSLAKSVRICHFTNWKLDDAGSWAVRLFAKKYIAGMLHMKNIRKLKFSASFVDAEHWSAIATLTSLEELSFDSCQFLQGPADIEPERRVKVKVSRLQVTDCTGHRQPIAAIDARCLRTLAMDFVFFDHVDWLPRSTLTELHLCLRRPLYMTQDWYLEHVHAILMRAPQSVQTLGLSVDARIGPAQSIVRSMFDDPAWKNLPLLRSLTLRVLCQDSDTPADVLSSALDGIALLIDLQSFTLRDYIIAPEISPTEIRRILHDRPASSLRYVDIYGKAFRLVDGEWSELSCSMV